MKLREILTIIESISNDNGYPKPYICGGVVRDFHLKNLQNISDLDMTNGDASITQLSKKVYEELNKKYNVVYKHHINNSSSVYIGGFKLDFSSHLIINNIDTKLAIHGITNPTDFDREMFSRDFTFNSMLLDFDFSKIIDYTGRGLHDLDNRILSTCLDPFLTFSNSNNRVARAIYLACKLGCEFHPNVVRCLKQHPELITISSSNSLIKKLNLAIGFDKNKVLRYLDEFNLWKYIPPIAMIEEDQKKRLLIGK